MRRKVLLGNLVLFALCLATESLAQCSWCYTVSEVCCDSDTSFSDISISCTASEVWVYYDKDAQNKVYVELWNLDTNSRLATAVLNCDCDRRKLYSGTLVSGTNLRFRAICYACSGGTCAIGNAHVKFFTPSSNACAPNCNGS